ncbi:MAG: phage holin family protein [Bacteroidota bacterium]|nr:phage holin family protein [Bacteroidota bacterium]
MENRDEADINSDGNLNENFFKNFKDTLYAYVEQRVEFTKLTLVEKIAITSGMIFSAFLIAFFVLMFLVFVSTVAGLALNYYLESSYLGFCWVSGFYLLIAVLTILFKKQIEKPVINAMIKMMLHE